jgi:hypothetical protein
MSPSRPVEFVADVSVGGWLAESLDEIDEWVALSCVVPPVFQAYARILHPVSAVRSHDAPQGPRPADASWSDVAGTTGRQMHPRVQFDSLIGVERGGDRDWEAEVGTLSPDLWEELSDVLRHHAADPSSCYFALWDGWGWASGNVEPAALPAEAVQGPRLSLEARDYLLFDGPLDAWASLFVDRLEGHWQSPQLCWPRDRTWCVATEIDYDSTYIGGSAELVAAVLEDPRFDSYPAQASDRVDFGGDDVNGLP